MNILFIHQNFPGQYKHLAPLLAEQGHTCVALSLRFKEPGTWKGVKLVPYAIKVEKKPEAHPWVLDFDTKVRRGHACFLAARKLKEDGFTPDLILGHHGWGEPMFLKDIWPEAKLALYCELYHQEDYPHLGFDPEFDGDDDVQARMRVRLKNINNHLHFDAADAGISPTKFQADSFPAPYRKMISVCHDGIDTDLSCPNPDANITLKVQGPLSRKDEVITFVNRNLEPYRGYHIFMRALPRILRERPNATVLIVGGDEVSYGAKPPDDRTWKQTFIDEVRGQILDEDWDRVRFLGRIPHDQFTTLLQLSRVHVYLTYPFVLSWSLLEAMSCEAAIVASDVEPVREVIEDGKTGLLVDFFDPDAIAERVCELLDDENLRKRLGKKARQKIIKQYDLKTVCIPRQLEWVDKVMSG